MSAARAALRHLPFALLLLVGLCPVLLYLWHQQDPESAVRLAHGIHRLLQQTLLATGLVLLGLLLLFPPARAGLRLCFAHLHRQFTTDRGPLLQALGELRHFASPQRHFEVGRLALAAGDLPLAAQHLDAAAAQTPDVAAVHYQYGRLLLRLGQPAAARGAFATAERLDPGHAFGDALLQHGRALWLLGQESAATAVFLSHRQRHGGSAQSLYWLGQALRRTGDAAAAHDAFAAAATAPGPRTAEADWYRAWARLQLHRPRATPPRSTP
ncbi:MAG: tetratricopeptide repeat protein [Planctomycetes bacterium]|nr:tetratricopeptide repeat protein [Planctomycetota bacterium]